MAIEGSSAEQSRVEQCRVEQRKGEQRSHFSIVQQNQKMLKNIERHGDEWSIDKKRGEDQKRTEKIKDQ